MAELDLSALLPIPQTQDSTQPQTQDPQPSMTLEEAINMQAMILRGEIPSREDLRRATQWLRQSRINAAQRPMKGKKKSEPVDLDTLLGDIGV